MQKGPTTRCRDPLEPSSSEPTGTSRRDDATRLTRRLADKWLGAWGRIVFEDDIIIDAGAKVLLKSGEKLTTRRKPSNPPPGAGRWPRAVQEPGTGHLLGHRLVKEATASPGRARDASCAT
jgi:hypothetical protein